MRSDDLYSLPPNLPVPTDDGACNHLEGMTVPTLALPSTAGGTVDLAATSHRAYVVVFCYPRTGQPDRDPPPGWDDIPGMRGCTPQACSFRDRHADLSALSARVFGLSTQDTAYQQEAATRLHLPYPLLSDADLRFATALRLPTVTLGGMTLIKRLTLILRQGVIRKVFYPVFPSDRNVEEVLVWLQTIPTY
jgi:peroxiredoxin